MIEKYLDRVKLSLEINDFPLALNLYQEIYNLYPDFFLDNRNRLRPYVKQHILNAANLARKEAYDKFSPARLSSSRMADAIDNFVGIKPIDFQHPFQKPSFFYVPNLETKAFYDLSEITGLESIFTQLEIYRNKFVTLLNGEKQNYVSLMGAVPDKEEWNELKKNNWLSVHLLKKGISCINNDDDIEALLNIFSHSCIADCPPHAPEVFISELTSGASIPEHFGLSNVKLTAHFPIDINMGSSLTVANETRYWSPEIKGIVFDDSLLHSAKNFGDIARSVLIFDVWNSCLTDAEKRAVKFFMDEHQKWYDKFGKLAFIDKN